MVVVITLMVGAYLFLRTPGNELASATEFDVQVASGTPTLVEFYSNT